MFNNLNLRLVSTSLAVVYGFNKVVDFALERLKNLIWDYCRGGHILVRAEFGPNLCKPKCVQLLNKLRLIVEHIVGNGSSTFVWLNNWHLLGRLGPPYHKFGETGV